MRSIRSLMSIHVQQAMLACRQIKCPYLGGTRISHTLHIISSPTQGCYQDCLRLWFGGHVLHDLAVTYWWYLHYSLVDCGNLQK
ncbi:hypothetical protein LMH87_003849 [Akanthomyces muscarius]|uniref:Uncharacterized protein n=1 Tax=Akanthomyces muscarius TaxID=2231603 RepID=A0A9W8Q491_AKAMU|nr:hypothetical protein LMH87_003849 [Akanthomyces muscarius]KAJ4144984.1 hypothetical protein LMH87_003849 [Akanthomyces muscarius]